MNTTENKSALDYYYWNNKLLYLTSNNLYSGDFETPLQGGAFRLENGNTLITQTHTSKILEVDIDGNEIWEYQYESELGSTWINRAQKYSLDYLLDINLGDLNGDGNYNVLDIVNLANCVLANNCGG